MGVERAVTRWYVQRQLIEREIATQQALLEQLPASAQSSPERAEAERRLAEARKRLLDLGTCPKPMMG